MIALIDILAFAFIASQAANCQEYEDIDPSYKDSNGQHQPYGDSDYNGLSAGPLYPSHNNNYGSYKNNVDCGPLSDPKNGKVEVVPDTKKASIAMYICDDGFILYGKGMRVCTGSSYGGKWSGKAPKCVPVICGGLPNIENGRLILSGIGYRDTATYLCKLGFDLIGDRQRKCKEDSEWSGVAPMCKKITCPELSTPDNGKLLVTGRIPSDIAIYSCKYGFYLDGQKRRECQRTGEWSGTGPTCKKIEPIVSKKTPPSYTPSYPVHEEPSDTYQEYDQIDSAPYHYNDDHY